MKKLLSVLVLTLAANFLLVVGGVAWLWTSGRLDREKVASLREVLQPKPTTQPVEVAVEPATEPAADPVSKMEDALATAAGRAEWADGGTAGELEGRRAAVESAAAALDRRKRELDDLQRLLATSRAKLEADRSALAAERKQYESDRAAAAALASDAGFQATLKLYQSMPAKQAKAIFLAMSDDSVVRYLSAMETRTQTKILREFKTPDETLRVKKLLELMRHDDPTVPPVPLATTAN